MVIELSIVLLVLVAFLVVVLSFVPVGLWISAVAAGVRVSIVTLIGMRLRRVPPAQIILPLIKAEKAGLDVSIDKLEAHYLAGGNVDRVVDALIATPFCRMIESEQGARIAGVTPVLRSCFGPGADRPVRRRC